MKIRKVKPLIRVLRGIRDNKSVITVGKHEDHKSWWEAAQFLNQMQKDGYIIMGNDYKLVLTDKGKLLLNKNKKLNEGNI